MVKKCPVGKKLKRAKIKKVMKEYKAGKLKAGSKKGKTIKKPRQALAIALSEAKKRSK